MDLARAEQANHTITIQENPAEPKNPSLKTHREGLHQADLLPVVIRASVTQMVQDNL
jgi:hypothetical protein